ncbi:sugar transporter [Holotrichia oblita]|uniref:Sugar transporter n=1 Tax=Holotrichia oblita TaxID=644536 RepID=A0ACB9TQ37_HOLOL|nr:sugar transporter [Holotrichia oblita]
MKGANNWVSLLTFSTGILYAFASPAIPKLLSDYGFTIEEAAYFPILPSIVMLFTTTIYCQLIDKIGRKWTLLSTGALQALSWLLIALAKDSYLIYISRALFGLSDAGVMATIPTYVAEVTTPNVRGLYGSIIVISAFLGHFVANCVGYYLSIQLTSFIMLPIPILFIILFSFMPETPYYFVMVGNIDGAMKSLQKLRGCENVQPELIQITLDVERQLSESGRFKDLFLIGSNRKALIVATISRSFQNYSGSNCIAVYSQYIFQEAGGDISSGVAGMIVSGLFALVNPFANFICDQLGRRKSMILSSLGCSLCLLAEAIYFYLQAFDVTDLSIINWFPVLGLASYSITFCLGLGLVPTLLLGEIFSTNIRRHGVTVTNTIVSANFCIVLKLFQLLMSTHGMWVPFLFFGLCCFVASIGSWFIVPETKGKTLEEIQQMLKEDVGSQSKNIKLKNVL